MKKAAVLIIDDDPSHLRIYGWIMQSAGFEAFSALVTFDALNLPDADIDLVLLDYQWTLCSVCAFDIRRCRSSSSQTP